MSLIYEDLTKILRGCIFETHNILGVGYDEETYHQGLIFHLKKRQIPFSSKERRIIKLRDVKIYEYELDLIVWDKIILELKSIQSDFLQVNYVQIISYLKLWEKSLGLLINFGLPRAKIKRIPFTNKEKNISENYDHIKGLINQDNKDQLMNIREAILYIYERLGLGFGDAVYQRALEVELIYRQINYETGVQIPVKLEGNIMRNYEMPLLLITNRFVCDIVSLHDKITFYSVSRMKTYLKALGLEFGLVANFGKKQLEIRAVSV